MGKWLLVSLALLQPWLPAAWAGTVLTQSVESAGGQGTMTIWIEGADLRTDVSPEVSMIFEGETGDTIWLRHPGKTFSRVTASESKALAERLRVAMPPGSEGKLEATGQKKQIGTSNTELFLWTVGELKFRFWIARDYPDGKAVEHLLERVQGSGMFQAAAALLPTQAVLPGVRLRTEMESQGQKTIYTLLSVTNRAVDRALFQIPAGYSETPFPGTP